MKDGLESFLTNLAFFTIFLADKRKQAQVMLKRFCTLGKLVNRRTKGITLLCIGKNNICISFAFNGFKDSFAIILMAERELVALILFSMMSGDCCVALPRGAIGLSAVCDCGIS